MKPSLRTSCEQLLRDNDRGGYTVPARNLYPNQWAWDSAFAAIGWAHFDPARAWVELRTLLDGQWADGRVPHIQFHVVRDDYFPNPDFWGTERTSSITQPPIWATAMRRVIEIAGPSDDVAELLRKVDASHRFFHHHRDPLDWGLVAVVHPWESGLDNCPAWDAPLARVPPADPELVRRKDRQNVGGDASVRPTDEHYARYAALVLQIAESGFGLGQFRVYDPLMTSVLARAERDLCWLGERYGVRTDAAERAAALGRALDERLWDEERGRYVYYDAEARQPIPCDVIGCYAPLWSGTSAERAGRLTAGLRERFWTPWPLASTAPSDPAFEPRRYWRGPSWVNINWMLLDSLGPELGNRTIELVRRSGFREYYHPDTAEGLGAEHFTWTAALVLDLLARGYQ